MDILNDMTIEQIINVIYHETIHFMCDLQGVEDIKKINGLQYHTKAFADMAQRYKGGCSRIDDKLGFHDIELKKETTQKIKKSL